MPQAQALVPIDRPLPEPRLPQSPEPDNIACDQAADLAFPSTIAATSTDVRSLSAATSCARDDDAALWFHFTAPADGRYTFVTDGGTGDRPLLDTTIAFFNNCALAASDTERGCVDDTADDLHAGSFLDLDAGEDVMVRVAGWGHTRGGFTLTVDHPEDLARPANDQCADAVPLSINGPSFGTTQNATGTDVSSCGDTDTSDIWYTFTAPDEGDYQFFLTDAQTSANEISVYGDCGTDERACHLGSAGAHVLADETVFVRVGTDPNAADTFNVNVTPTPPRIAPINDDFTNALPLALDQTVHATTIDAAQDALDWGKTCGPFVHGAVWYSFTAPVDGAYVFDTSGSGMADTIVAVFGACGQNGAQVPPLLGCDDDSGAQHWGRIDVGMLQGTSLCVAVAGRFLSDGGDFTLSATLEAAHPQNDECEGALPLVDVVHGDNFASRSVSVATDACQTEDRALWYVYQAPADGQPHDVKFDSKVDDDAQPDLSLFHGCGQAPFACELDHPHPSISTVLNSGEKVFVRASTNVFLRKPMSIRASP